MHSPFTPSLFVPRHDYYDYIRKPTKLGLCSVASRQVEVNDIGDHHPPLWLKEHPYIPAPKKVASSRGRRTAPIDASPAKKKKKVAKTKKRATPSSVSLAKTLKKKKIAAAKTGTTKGVVIQESVVQGPPSVGGSVPQGVSTPISKRQVRKTRAGKKTFTAPLSSSLATSAAARRVARDIVYTERRVGVSSLLFYLSFGMLLLWY